MWPSQLSLCARMNFIMFLRFINFFINTILICCHIFQFFHVSEWYMTSFCVLMLSCILFMRHEQNSQHVLPGRYSYYRQINILFYSMYVCSQWQGPLILQVSLLLI
jgi:glycerol-3-phosphate acyltransferase PlsY